MKIINSRIKLFLNEKQYNDEFSNNPVLIFLYRISLKKEIWIRKLIFVLIEKNQSN